MPQKTVASVENTFTKGLKTEFTGMNFPENAATDTDNCIYTLIGNVTRREGFDYELNFALNTIDRASKAISSYKWKNAGGDGSTQLMVLQVGATLRFFSISGSTVAAPLSTTILGSTVDISSFVASGGTFTASKECQYADGNGYLIVFHPDCDPFYCIYSGGTITGNLITVQIRDFQGVVETVPDNFRPTTNSANHQYNLQNQGWTNAPSWSATSTTSNNTNTGLHTWTVQTGLTISAGQTVTISSTKAGGGFNDVTESGTVSGYNSGTGALVINVTSTSFSGGVTAVWTFTSLNVGFITTWFSAVLNFPSNSDIWWAFKNASDVFSPSTTIGNITLDTGPAPKGHYIFNAFNINRATTSGLSVSSEWNQSTLVRPRTGAWFQGRIWYTGVDASFSSSTSHYVWSENIYFSQIVVTPEQFGKCYQTNDPTSETKFSLLPNDGGVIKIQGSGAIYKLVPLQSGLIVFAANGIWFIGGSSAIGFIANDYNIIKISGIQSISSTSFIDVNGYPMFWNEEGIYYVTPAKDGGSQHSPDVMLDVKNLCLGTILSYYADIPLQSKKFARGDYNPLDYTAQWVFRSTNESSTTDRYQNDKILCLNVANGSFYPYSMTGTPWIHDIKYVAGPGGSTSPDPVFKYLVSASYSGTYKFTFAEEFKTTYTDWAAFDSVGVDYSSYFVTGYKLHGEAQRRFQSNYIYVYSNNSVNTKYRIQGIWNFAISGDSGKYSPLELANLNEDTDNYGIVYRRHRVRGRGLVLQFKITSVTANPFNVQGWSVEEKQNTGV